ncbi:MAG: hypothetical protein BGP06_20780 [Rhizobiales bacterium 65-9]|nr:fumarylacetoacetate hydrolase family protein [Hyphomicrobiales bacterium]OJY36464.1 MAG: hypothetical protein BGP06_20780 [Rhizobiales bacterium 65-9]
MSDASRAEAAALFIRDAHRARRRFENLPDALAPADIDGAYDIQEALHRLLIPELGPIAGVKIATTTKVMQALMGIGHPCGGAIFASRIHQSPAEIDLAPFVNLRGECEIAVRLGRDLAGSEVTAAAARAAVEAAAPAFELIEDRGADYRNTRAASLIADNAWNAGIVVGEWRPLSDSDEIENAEGALSYDGAEQGRGRPDDPFGALAWLAGLSASRGRPLKAGMIVITGSLIPTFTPPKGAEVLFALNGWGETRMRLR